MTDDGWNNGETKYVWGTEESLSMSVESDVTYIDIDGTSVKIPSAGVTWDDHKLTITGDCPELTYIHVKDADNDITIDVQGTVNVVSDREDIGGVIKIETNKNVTFTGGGIINVKMTAFQEQELVGLNVDNASDTANDTGNTVKFENISINIEYTGEKGDGDSIHGININSKNVELNDTEMSIDGCPYGLTVNGGYTTIDNESQFRYSISSVEDPQIISSEFGIITDKIPSGSVGDLSFKDSSFNDVPWSGNGSIILVYSEGKTDVEMSFVDPPVPPEPEYNKEVEIGHDFVILIKNTDDIDDFKLYRDGKPIDLKDGDYKKETTDDGVKITVFAKTLDQPGKYSFKVNVGSEVIDGSFEVLPSSEPSVEPSNDGTQIVAIVAGILVALIMLMLFFVISRS